MPNQVVVRVRIDPLVLEKLAALPARVERAAKKAVRREMKRIAAPHVAATVAAYNATVPPGWHE